MKPRSLLIWSARAVPAIHFSTAYARNSRTGSTFTTPRSRSRPAVTYASSLRPRWCRGGGVGCAIALTHDPENRVPVFRRTNAKQKSHPALAIGPVSVSLLGCFDAVGGG